MPNEIGTYLAMTGEEIGDGDLKKFGLIRDYTNYSLNEYNLKVFSHSEAGFNLYNKEFDH
jgi:hypothetical protein